MLNTQMIGHKIAEARKQMNLSQARLAQRLFISPQAVGKWERGESMPDIITFNRLADILGVDLNFFSENLPAPDTEKERSPEHIDDTEDHSPDDDHSPVSPGRPLLTDFSGSNLAESDFAGITAHPRKFEGSSLRGSDFSGADLTGSSFKGRPVRRAYILQSQPGTFLPLEARNSKLPYSNSLFITAIISSKFRGNAEPTRKPLRSSKNTVG